MPSFLLTVSLLFLTGGFLQDDTDQKKESLPFRWVQVGTQLEPVSLKSPTLEKLKAYAEYAPFIEAEQEVTQVDEFTQRTVTRAFRLDPRGKPRLTEVVEETLRRLPGGGWKAVKTVSSMDANQKLQLSRRETQEVLPTGEGSFQTSRTTELASPSGRLREVEKLEQSERRLDDEVVEMERVQYQMGANGRWETVEQRAASYRESDSGVAGREQVYRKDAMGRMSLSEEIAGQAWQDEAGQYRTIERQIPNLDGKLELTERVTVSRAQLEDGSVTTVQETASRPVGTGNSNLKLVERITERSTEESETETSVEARDLTDRIVQVTSFTTTRQGDGKNKTLQKVRSPN